MKIQLKRRITSHQEDCHLIPLLTFNSPHFVHCGKTTIFAEKLTSLSAQVLTEVSMNRFFIILSTVLVLLSSCSGRQQGEAVQSSEGFDITGAWALISQTYPSGRVVETNLKDYSRCKIYGSDSSYYCVQLRFFGGDVFVEPHEKGDYSLHDTIYIENGRLTPFQWINDSTMTTAFMGIIETWRRSTTMTESRKEEIRNIFRYHQKKATAEEPLLEYVLSTGERKLQHTISIYHYLFVALLSVILVVIIYAVELTKRKRRVEQNLAAIKEELSQRPALIADAIKQVEDDFFQSDYYNHLRERIAAGINMTDEDWREMEHQVNAMSSGFTRKLRSLYDFSDVEYQVCLLIKLRIPHKDIAAITHRAPDGVSSIRSRLHKKILGPNGGAKEWDYFVLSL